MHGHAPMDPLGPLAGLGAGPRRKSAGITATHDAQLPTLVFRGVCLSVDLLYAVGSKEPYPEQLTPRGFPGLLPSAAGRGHGSRPGAARPLLPQVTPSAKGLVCKARPRDCASRDGEPQDAAETRRGFANGGEVDEKAARGEHRSTGPGT